MIEVKGGTFMMGNTFGVSESSGYDDALPIHEVSLEEIFRLNTFE